MRSKADISQLNLPHGTDNYKSVKTEKLKCKKRICLEVTVKVWGIHVVSPEEEKEGCGGKDLQERKVLCLK